MCTVLCKSKMQTHRIPHIVQPLFNVLTKTMHSRSARPCCLHEFKVCLLLSQSHSSAPFHLPVLCVRTFSSRIHSNEYSFAFVCDVWLYALCYCCHDFIGAGTALDSIKIIQRKQAKHKHRGSIHMRVLPDRPISYRIGIEHEIGWIKRTKWICNLYFILSAHFVADLQRTANDICVFQEHRIDMPTTTIGCTLFVCLSVCWCGCCCFLCFRWWYAAGWGHILGEFACGYTDLQFHFYTQRCTWWMGCNQETIFLPTISCSTGKITDFSQMHQLKKNENSTQHSLHILQILIVSEHTCQLAKQAWFGLHTNSLCKLFRIIEITVLYTVIAMKYAHIFTAFLFRECQTVFISWKYGSSVAKSYAWFVWNSTMNRIEAYNCTGF